MNAAPYSEIDIAQKKFNAWLEKNPAVVEIFRKFAHEAKDSGQTKYGVKAIAERVRWHTTIERKDADFKLNNNNVSRLARHLMSIDSELEDFFETRRLASQRVREEKKI